MTDKKSPEVTPVFETAGQEQAPEPSNQEVVAEGNQFIEKIDGVATNFRAEEGSDEPDLTAEVDVLANVSKKEVKLVLDGKPEAPKIPEFENFDYSGANDWLELYSQIGQHMKEIDADMVTDRINAFRRGKINEKEIPGTLESHLKEAVLKLHNRDLLINEKPSEPVINLEIPVQDNIKSSEAIVTDTMENEPVIFEAKHDIRDARIKGSISRLKALLDEINIAIQKSDRTLKQRSLEQAAVLLNDPRFADQSTELSSTLEQAQLSVENKIRDLEVEIKTAQMERLIAPLKDLITEINSAKTRETKLSALQEAAQLLGKPDLATAILQKSKEEQDLLVPDALEQAVLLAEARIRKIEDEINKLKNGAEKKPIVNPEPETIKPAATSPETPPEVVSEPVPGPKTESGQKPEKTVILPERTAEQIATFDDARAKYFDLVKKRKRIFSKNRNFLIGGYKEEAQDELDSAHDKYESLKHGEIIEIIEAMKAGGELDPKVLAEAYIKYLQKEESNVDALAESGDKNTMNKFKEWWKRHSKARLVAGIGLMAVGAGATFASGGILGSLTNAVASNVFASSAFVAGRTITSGGGTYMTAEGLMDTKTKRLGQKGLIDEVHGYNFYKEKDKNNHDRLLHVFEASLKEKSLSDLGVELARLRGMGLEKGVGVAEAGRFGAAQSEVVKTLEKIYYEKLKESVLDKTKEKAGQKEKGKEEVAGTEDSAEQKKQETANRLLNVLKGKTEDERAEQLIPEVDKYRTKSMIRQGVSIGLGVGAGIYSNIMAAKMMAKSVADAAEQAAHAANEAATNSTQVAAEQAVEQNTKNIDFVVKVKKGDSLWKIIEAKVHEQMGDEKWSALGEAKQTHMIDAVKDSAAAHPEAFGLHHDIDQLIPGENIDLSSVLGHSDSIDHLQAGADAMAAAGGEANILANNDALEAAAKAGVRLTTENVDVVSHEVRSFGTDFLSPNGSVHEWTFNGQAVDRLADGSFTLADSHQAISSDQLANVLNHAKESAQHLVDTEIAAKTAAEAATAQAAEAATQAAAQQQMETFLTQGGDYNHGLYEAANNSGHLDELVAKVVASGNQEQLSGLVHDYVRDHGWSEEKTNLFINALKRGDKIDLSSGHFDLSNPQIIAENMHGFEASALDSFDKVKDIPSGHWVPVKMGDEYALVQKYHTGVWPLRSDHYLIDTDGDHKVDALKLDDNAMRQAFLKKGAESIKSTVRGVINKFPPGSHPSPM
ncbi:MAG: hypothetical protein WCV69_00770 [Patescibacteria group bacterium]|jgi:hypothetical protein